MPGNSFGKLSASPPPASATGPATSSSSTAARPGCRSRTRRPAARPAPPPARAVEAHHAARGGRRRRDLVRRLRGTHRRHADRHPLPQRRPAPRDYGDIKDKYRPGHADFTFDAKYGFRDYRGGGRSSARETIVPRRRRRGRQEAAAPQQGVRDPRLRQAGRRSSSPTIADPTAVTLEQVEATPVRCPDPGGGRRG